MILRIEKLAREHHIDSFSCGQPDLDQFLKRFALANQSANSAQTYVGLTADIVIGFYTLVVGEVAFERAPSRLTKGLARHPVPIMLLARLGVDVAWQGKRIGAGLLKDATVRTLQAAEIAGIRALAVYAKDETAADFYRRFDFVASPSDALHLFVLLKDLR